MKIIYFAVFFIISAVTFTGCNTLPPGKAPVGNITSPEVTSRKQLDWRAAANYMTTALTAFCLQEFPQGCEFQIDFKADDPALNVWPLKTVTQTRRSVPIKPANGPGVRYELTSRIFKDQKTVWEMRLVRIEDNQPLWNEKVTIKEKKNLEP
ncbi:hypothetical protein P0136_12100 [Lentisphaerota bacterium ZTH]|nr:hypothetical protein JYG24_10385 [Lentisphaerota bacterium]WET06100.1 hypothetical protein P0136_12100 [Lentisphaerota bacterium ZTH]